MPTLAKLTLGLACLALPGAALAQTATLDGTAITLETVASGLDLPTGLTAPPGDPRLFVLEQSGRIRIILDGRLASDPFLDIEDAISSGGERGLLGLAFHPRYADNGRFFLYFTDPSGNIRIAEMRASADPDRADPASLLTLLTIDHSMAANHNGGWLAFGPDGLLYIGVGDGGGAGDRRDNAQNPDRLLGKLLRIDVDQSPPYAIPPTNPFAQGGGAPEIFALGLRNPWRNAFDGNDLYIADVGQNQWEEINIIPLTETGANFGWNRMEGFACFRGAACDPADFTLPVHAYGHDLGCSITGGHVYRGAALPALRGRYFFSDWCAGELMSLRYSDGRVTGIVNSSETLGSLGNVTSFGQDGAGELYILASEGTVARLVAAPD